MRIKGNLYFAPLLFILCSLLFYFLPEIDIIVSRWFYTEESGFYLNNHFLVQLSYRIFADIHWLFFFGLLWLLFASWFWQRSSEKLLRRKIMYMLLVLILGPGLTVSALKDNMGRPRPSQVHEFGGTAQFQPVFVLSEECDRNCSFVSGHASIAFYLVCLAWVFNGRYWLWAGITLGTLAGLGRIIQGAHFLSDAVFSFWVIYAVCVVLAWWILGQKPCFIRLTSSSKD